MSVMAQVPTANDTVRMTGFAAFSPQYVYGTYNQGGVNYRVPYIHINSNWDLFTTSKYVRAFYTPQTTTIAGFPLSGNITLANHTPGLGLIGSVYNGSLAQVIIADTAYLHNLTQPQISTLASRIVANTSAIALKQPRIILANPGAPSTTIATGDTVNMALWKLQTQLNGIPATYVPYTGATSDLNLGTHNILLGPILTLGSGGSNINGTTSLVYTAANGNHDFINGSDASVLLQLGDGTHSPLSFTPHLQVTKTASLPNDVVNLSTLTNTIAAIPVPTASLGVIKTGNIFTLDTAFSHNIVNPQINTLASRIAGNTTAILTKQDTSLINIAALQAYTGVMKSIFVRDVNRGGIFNYSATGVADNGVTFAVGSGYYVRKVEKNNYAYIGWWGTNMAAIQSAVAYAGASGTVELSPGQIYPQTDEIIPLENQTFIGNFATLQRQVEVSTTLTVTANATDVTLTVASVPATWVVGNYIQIYQTISSTGASYRIKITGISGNTITLANAPGNAYLNGSTTYASGSFVRKVYHQFTSIVNTAYTNNGWTLPGDFEVRNLIFDGQSSLTSQNLFWGVNAAIYSMSYNQHQRIIGCRFINIPNDCLNGQGWYVTKCYYNNMNNSFIHFSGDYSVAPKQIDSHIFDNSGVNSNQVLSTTGSQHSEGVITLSFSSGYATIHDNMFNGGLNNILGTTSQGATSMSGGTRYLMFHHNRCYNFAGIIGISYSATFTSKPGNIIIDGNTLSNCGNTSPFPATGSSNWAYIDKIQWSNNILADATVVSPIPVEVQNTSDFIVNTFGTTNIEANASLFIGGSAVAGTTALSTVPSGGASANFIPLMGSSAISGQSGLGVYVADGTNQTRASLMVNNTDRVWGLTSNYSTSASPFVINAGGNEWMRLSSSGLTIANIAADASTATNFLTTVSGLVQSRTPAQVLADILAAPLANPNFTGTLNAPIGIFSISAKVGVGSAATIPSGDGSTTFTPQLAISATTASTQGWGLSYYDANNHRWGAFNNATSIGFGQQYSTSSKPWQFYDATTLRLQLSNGLLRLPVYTTGLAHFDASGNITSSTVTTSDIAANAVTYAKIQAVTTNKLLGSGSGTSAAEITLGTNLSFTGTTLNSSNSILSLFTNYLTTTVANTITETTVLPSGVGSLTIPIGIIGKQFRAVMGGVYSTTPVTAGNLTVNIYYGGTIIATGTITGFAAGSTNFAINSILKISTITVGASGSVQVDGFLNYSVGNNLARLTIDLNNTGNAVTVNNSVAQNYDMKVIWSAASPSDIIKTTQFSLESLN
jgi:hypothetical protein